MPRAIDITGNVYWDQLTALERLPGGKWLFLCKCGTEKPLDAYNVKSGNTKSCGCTRYQFAPKDCNSRRCIVCNQPFSPKRSDTRICYRTECFDNYIKSKRAKAKSERLKPKACLICKKEFTPARSNQVCCSPVCNDKKQKAKKAAEVAEHLSQITRVCKYRCCNNTFTPKQRKDQVFCSERCSLLQGRLDWKLRNIEKVRADQNKRNAFRYKNDPEYKARVRGWRHAEYHSLTPEQKRERNRRNRSQRDQTELKRYSREYHAKRLASDINFKLISVLRSRTRSAIKNGKGIKDRKTVDLIGCSVSELRGHIESVFEEGMTWDNWALDGWHLDHIRPCNSFDLKSKAQQKTCFNWRNYRPLWGSENISKNDNYQAVDEIAWIKHMRSLGFEGEVFPRFQQ